MGMDYEVSGIIGKETFLGYCPTGIKGHIINVRWKGVILRSTIILSTSKN